MDACKYIITYYKLPYKHNFISTQGPKGTTVNDLWQMICDYEVEYIIMLCNLKESGRSKCHEYWPSKGSITFDFAKITIIKEGRISKNSNLIKREFSFEKGYN